MTLPRVLVGNPDEIGPLQKPAAEQVRGFLADTGFKVPGEKEEDVYRCQMHFERILSGLPTTLLVCSPGKPDALA